ncbi:MAG: hypothetical protein AAB257_04980 [Nitrospinota bacterium]
MKGLRNVKTAISGIYAALHVLQRSMAEATFMERQNSANSIRK